MILLLSMYIVHVMSALISKLKFNHRDFSPKIKEAARCTALYCTVQH